MGAVTFPFAAVGCCVAGMMEGASDQSYSEARRRGVTFDTREEWNATASQLRSNACSLEENSYGLLAPNFALFKCMNPFGCADSNQERTKVIWVRESDPTAPLISSNQS